MEELNSRNIPYEVRVYAEVDNRIRMILPVIAEGNPNNSGISYQDPALRDLMESGGSVDRKIIQMSLYHHDIKSFSEAFHPELEQPLIMVVDLDGAGFFSPLKFEDFNNLMIKCDQIREERIFGEEQDEVEPEMSKS
jgi:hypothetical protein